MRHFRQPPGPTQRLGNITGKADVYALGCVLFHMLSGRAPFLGGVGEIIAAQVYEQPPNLRQLAPGTPARLAELVEWMLKKAPEERPSMAEARDALTTLESGNMPTLRGVTADALATLVGQRAPIAPPPSGGRATRIVIAAAVTVLLGGGVLAAILLMQKHGSDAPPKAPEVAPKPPEAKKPVAPERPARVFLVVKSDPPGAEVVNSDGIVVGKTPWIGEEDKRPGASLAYTLRRAGFADLPITVDVGDDQKLTFKLKPKGKRGSGDDEPAVVPLH